MRINETITKKLWESKGISATLLETGRILLKYISIYTANAMKDDMHPWRILYFIYFIIDIGYLYVNEYTCDIIERPLNEIRKLITINLVIIGSEHTLIVYVPLVISIVPTKKLESILLVEEERKLLLKAMSSRALFFIIFINTEKIVINPPTITEVFMASSIPFLKAFPILISSVSISYMLFESRFEILGFVITPIKKQEAIFENNSMYPK